MDFFGFLLFLEMTSTLMIAIYNIVKIVQSQMELNITNQFFTAELRLSLAIKLYCVLSSCRKFYYCTTL